MSESRLVDIIPPELLNEPSIIINGDLYNNIISKAEAIPRLRTPFPAKNLSEAYGLVKNVITNYETRENVADSKKVVFTEEEPDYDHPEAVTIAFALVKREPGAFGKGGPMGGNVKNYKPILREEIEDPENPGYKRAILGYFHDNEVKFTIFAMTNKVANERALWFEGFMQEYSWYFTSQGVSRFLFLKREADYVSEVKGQKLYARPIHFFIKTETLTTISQKKLSQITVGAAKNPIPSLLNDV